MWLIIWDSKSRVRSLDPKVKDILELHLVGSTDTWKCEGMVDSFGVIEQHLIGCCWLTLLLQRFILISMILESGL
jgi:hypothetical protein